MCLAVYARFWRRGVSARVHAIALIVIGIADTVSRLNCAADEIRITPDTFAAAPVAARTGAAGNPVLPHNAVGCAGDSVARWSAAAAALSRRSLAWLAWCRFLAWLAWRRSLAWLVWCRSVAWLAWRLAFAWWPRRLAFAWRAWWPWWLDPANSRAARGTLPTLTAPCNP